jgi:hypothetical protein
MHLEQQHTNDWIQFQALNQAERASFFSNMKDIGGINAFLNKTKESIKFVTQADIFEKLIGELFFHPEEDEEGEDVEPATKPKAMKLLKQQDDGNYLVSVMNPLCGRLGVGAIGRVPVWCTDEVRRGPARGRGCQSRVVRTGRACRFTHGRHTCTR